MANMMNNMMPHDPNVGQPYNLANLLEQRCVEIEARLTDRIEKLTTQGTMSAQECRHSIMSMLLGNANNMLVHEMLEEADKISNYILTGKLPAKDG